MLSQYTDKEEKCFVRKKRSSKADVEGYFWVCFYLIQWQKEFSAMPVCILICHNYPQCNVNRFQWLFCKWKTLSTCKDTAVTHLKAVWQVPSNKERWTKQGRTLVSLHHCVSPECWRFLSSLWRTWLWMTCPTQKLILKAEVTKYNVRRKSCEKTKEVKSIQASQLLFSILTHMGGGIVSFYWSNVWLVSMFVSKNVNFSVTVLIALKKNVQGSPQLNSERQTYVSQQQFHHFQSDRAGPPVGVN